MESNYSYAGFENRETAEHLKAGEVCKVTGIGNSMTPILKSRQPVICMPIDDNTIIKKRDIVMCKANGHYYLHLVHAVKENGKIFLIGNNHGHMNGWVRRSNIYGKVIEIL